MTQRTIHTPPGPRIALVVAAAENGVIGRGNRLPWHLPADLKHFKAVTMGKPMLMGRKTFESIGGALPGRRSLVLTHDAEYARAGAERVASLEDALALVSDAEELAVIGGAEVFRVALPRAERIYFTRVHASVAGDTRFPEIDWNEWRCTERTAHPVDEKNSYAMTFFVLEKQIP